jgi:DNA-binding MarR family transcriptional regulator
MAATASKRRSEDRSNTSRTREAAGTPRASAHGGAKDDAFFIEAFIPYLINHVADRYNKQFKQALKAAGLTVPQWRVIAVLNAAGGLSFTAIQDLTVIDQPTLSRTVDQMVKQGTVLRASRPGDARFAVVSLTEKGRKAYETFWPVAWGAYAAGIQGIPEGDLKVMRATLKRMLSNLKANPFAR